MRKLSILLFLFLALILSACARRQTAAVVGPERISPVLAHERVTGGDALLVCAYEDEDVCRRFPLKGAMTLDEFESKLMNIPPNTEIIFYCA